MKYHSTTRQMSNQAIALITAAILLITLVIRFIGHPSKAAGFLSTLLSLPFYLKIEGSSIQIGDSIVASGVGQTFPLGLAAVVVFYCLAIPYILMSKIRLRTSPLNIPIRMLILTNILALLFGLFKSAELANVLFFLQTVAPISCFFIALTFLNNVEALRGVFDRSVLVVGCFTLALIIYSVTQVGVIAMVSGGLFGYLGIFPIYGLFDYFPLVVTVSYGLGLALILGKVPTTNRFLITLLTLTMMCAMLFLRSKGAILTAGLITVIQVKQFGQSARAIGRFIFLSAMVAAMASWIFANSDPLTAQMFKSFTQMGSSDESFQQRLGAQKNAISIILDSPLTGVGYIAHDTDSGIGNMWNPHNQYLTYALRGGAISLFLVLWIIFHVCRRLYRLSANAASPLIEALGRGLFAILLGVSLVSNMFQDNLIQPYSGCILWFLMGVGEALYIMNRQSLAALKQDGPTIDFPGRMETASANR